MDKENKNAGIWDRIPDEWGKISEDTEISAVNEKENSDGNRSKKTSEDSEGSQSAGRIDGTETKEYSKIPAEKRNERSRNRSKEQVKSKEKQKKQKLPVQRVGESDRRGRQKDILIFLLVAVFVLASTVVSVLLVSRQQNSEIHRMIANQQYGNAYQEIRGQFEAGETVDSLIRELVEGCLRDKEYKRAVAAIEMLSEETEENALFLAETVKTLIFAGKQNRAEEVLQQMELHGGIIGSQAEDLKEQYKNELGEL